MSIFDMIQTAEQKAETVRQLANEQVKTLLETTRIKSEEEAQELHKQAEKQLLELEASFAKEIKEKQMAIDNKALHEDELRVKNARKQYDIAIDFILKKVIIK